MASGAAGKQPGADDDLTAALRAAAVAAARLRGVTARLRCHPSVERELLALPAPYARAGRDGLLEAVTFGVGADVDPRLEPGEWRVELAGRLPGWPR